MIRLKEGFLCSCWNNCFVLLAFFDRREPMWGRNGHYAWTPRLHEQVDLVNWHRDSNRHDGATYVKNPKNEISWQIIQFIFTWLMNCLQTDVTFHKNKTKPEMDVGGETRKNKQNIWYGNMYNLKMMGFEQTIVSHSLEFRVGKEEIESGNKTLKSETRSIKIENHFRLKVHYHE